MYSASYIYRATLHVENNSGNDIPQMTFFVGAYETGDLGWPYASAHEVGTGQLNFGERRMIHPGISDIAVELYIDREVLKCHNGLLEKPLLFLFNLGDQYHSVPVGHEINRELEQIACGSAP